MYLCISVAVDWKSVTDYKATDTELYLVEFAVFMILPNVLHRSAHITAVI